MGTSKSKQTSKRDITIPAIPALPNATVENLKQSSISLVTPDGTKFTKKRLLPLTFSNFYIVKMLYNEWNHSIILLLFPHDPFGVSGIRIEIIDYETHKRNHVIQELDPNAKIGDMILSSPPPSYTSNEELRKIHKGKLVVGCAFSLKIWDLNTYQCQAIVKGTGDYIGTIMDCQKDLDKGIALLITYPPVFDINRQKLYFWKVDYSKPENSRLLYKASQIEIDATHTCSMIDFISANAKNTLIAYSKMSSLFVISLSCSQNSRLLKGISIDKLEDKAEGFIKNLAFSKKYNDIVVFLYSISQNYQLKAISIYSGKILWSHPASLWQNNFYRDFENREFLIGFPMNKSLKFIDVLTGQIVYSVGFSGDNVRVRSLTLHNLFNTLFAAQEVAWRKKYIIEEILWEAKPEDKGFRKGNQASI